MLDKVSKVLLSQVRRCSTPVRGGAALRPTYEVFRTEMDNGMKVASAKTLGTKLAACTVMFQAGSRVEIDDELGATHFIRAATTTTGCAYSGFMKSRYVYELGGSILCRSDRQSICFTLTCLPSNFNQLKNYLIDVAYRCLFFEWELDDKVRPMIEDDLKRRPKDEHALDLVQSALFGGGLNNSIYCLEERMKTVDQEVLRGFTRKNFRTDNCSVGSIGLPYEDVLKVAENISCAVFDRPKKPCIPRSLVRSGVETYDYGPGADTCVAVAVPGCGYRNTRDVIKHALLAAATGYGSVFCGSHLYNKTPQMPLGQSCVDHFTRMKAFSISYHETGVFGILVCTTSECANQRAIQASNYLAKIGSTTAEQFAVGKKRLLVDLGRHDQSSTRMAEGMALYVASGASRMDTVNDMCCLINSITNDEMSDTASCIAQKVKHGELAIGVAGDVQAVPDLGLIFGC